MPIPWKSFRSHLIIALIGLILVTVPRGNLGAQAGNEYEVKAAFLYKFASFVEWPSEFSPTPAALCIAVVGQDPFGGALDEVVKGKSINGRKFSIRRFKSGRDATACQIVFISTSEKSRIRSILDQLDRAGILTVSEIAGFCQAGGMINFELLDEKVRFEVNPEAAERGGLRLSSKLLSVAKVVRDGKPQ